LRDDQLSVRPGHVEQALRAVGSVEHVLEVIELASGGDGDAPRLGRGRESGLLDHEQLVAVGLPLLG
jgi:hypothetical protein